MRKSEKKGIAVLFLSIILIHIGVEFGLIFLIPNYELNIVSNFLISELMILIPGLIYLFWFKCKQKNKEESVMTDVVPYAQGEHEKLSDRLGFHKIKISTFFMIILFTYLLMPLTTLLNAISMLFVDNAVLTMSPQMLEEPFYVVFFFVAMYAPFCEELIFRGIIFRGYKKTGNALAAVVLSGFLFGVMHLNFNQAGYAFAIGIAMALLVEASGSIWSSMLCHLIFNAQSVCLLFLEKYLAPELLSSQMDMELGNEQMYIMISVYFVIAAITTAVDICVLYWIAKNENRGENLKRLIKIKGSENLFTPVLIASLVIAFGFMIFVSVI